MRFAGIEILRRHHSAGSANPDQPPLRDRPSPAPTIELPAFGPWRLAAIATVTLAEAFRRVVRIRRTLTAIALSFVSVVAASAAGPHLLLLDAAVVGTDIVAVGEAGSILRSSDSGKTWLAVPAPVSATLTGITFASDNLHGWAVGHDAVILATADAGRTWSTQWQGPDLESSFLDVCAIDASRVIAVGAYGLCMATQDGGKTWVPQKPLDEDMHLNRITKGPTGTLYLAGERGTLLRSNNSGRTWLRIDSPYDGSFYGILPLGPETLLAHGLRGRVFRSTTDGDDWTPVRLDRPMLIATAAKTVNGAIYLAGQARALWVSRDDGASFTATAPEFTDAVAELVQAPDGTLLAFGEVGVTRLELK